jgi:hypothetical protein
MYRLLFVVPSLFFWSHLLQVNPQDNTLDYSWDVIQTDNDTVRITNPREVGLYAGKGHWVKITGPVRGVFYKKNTPPSYPTFIDLFEAYPDNAFAVVVFEEDKPNFPPLEATFNGQMVEITGQPIRYVFAREDGTLFPRVTFILKDPAQIRILN